MVQVNTEENTAIASRFQVRGIPMVILLRGQKVIDSVSGALDTGALVAWCRRHLP